MIRRKQDPPRGILHVPATQPVNGHWRYHPSEDLASFVEHYWTVEWDLATPRTAENLPHPSVHLVLEVDRAEIYGVMRRRFSRVLQGKGRVLGVKFRPGGFRAFVAQPVVELTDRRLPLQQVLGRTAHGLERRALRHDDHAAAIAVIEAFLHQRKPRPDPSIALAGQVCERIASDHAIIRVEQVAEAFKLGTRALQRLFSNYIGVSPKWVIQRYRLHEAAARIAAGGAVDWAQTALELGYADQAHFIRDFKKLVGRAPADYSRRLAQA
jgi:AraC-like DNA-binding protein